MNIVNSNIDFGIAYLQSSVPAVNEAKWAIVAVAAILFIAALALSIFFLLKDRIVPVASKMMQSNDNIVEDTTAAPDKETMDQKAVAESSIPSSPNVTDLLIEPDCINKGDNVQITFKVVNYSKETVTYKPNVRIDGKIKQSNSVSLPPETAIKMAFTVNANVVGIIHVEVDNLNGEFKVLPPKVLRLLE